MLLYVETKQEADRQNRQASDNKIGGKTAVFGLLPRGYSLNECTGEPQDILPEVPDYSDKRTKMNRDIECESLILPPQNNRR